MGALISKLVSLEKAFSFPEASVLLSIANAYSTTKGAVSKVALDAIVVKPGESVRIEGFDQKKWCKGMTGFRFLTTLKKRAI